MVELKPVGVASTSTKINSTIINSVKSIFERFHSKQILSPPIQTNTKYIGCHISPESNKIPNKP